MIKITRRLKANNFESVDYEVYTKEEFQKIGKMYKHWNECNPGDWGISDDGYVAECLQRNIYGTNVEMVFPYGRQWAKKTAKLEFEPHYRSKNYSNVSTKSYAELEAGRDRAELAIDAFLAYKMAGETPDMQKIGRIYRPDQKKPEIAVRKLLKTKEVKKIMADKLKEILVDKEIDEGYVLDVMKDAIDTAKVKEDPANMIRAAKELSVFLDMQPKNKQVTESIEMDMSHQIADTYDKQTKKLKATQTRMLDEEND
jgi:hypothetical protein